SRSTVGTATEIYDYLRLLWARIGKQYCVACGGEVRADAVQQVVDSLKEGGQPGSRAARIVIAFPLPPAVKAKHEQVVENLTAMGFVRVMIDGETLRLDDLPNKLDLAKAKNVLVVVDRVAANDAERLADSIATGYAEGEGIAVAVTEGGG